MITAVVKILLSKPISSEEALRAFESTAPIYKGLRGLLRKYYLRSEMAGTWEASMFGRRGPMRWPFTRPNGRRA